MSQGTQKDDDQVTAAVLVIGDEILSGRTQDTNVNHIARTLGEIGIILREARVVSDQAERIVEAVNALRAQYDYVFTTGGIGPTHDDITADAVAQAFGVRIDRHEEAYRRLEAHYRTSGIEFNAARQRMARIPDGATLIDNPVSAAPGFSIGNVHVMAGIPKIMQAMLDGLLPCLRGGELIRTVTVTGNVPEGTIAADMADLQQSHPQTSIGLYPYYIAGKAGVSVVVRGRDMDELREMAGLVESAIIAAGGQIGERPSER